MNKKEYNKEYYIKNRDKLLKGMKKYRQSAKGKEIIAKNQQSDKFKKQQKKYMQSKHGKEVKAKYQQSDNFKRAKVKYQQSDKFKKTIAKYQQSERGKELNKRKMAKRKRNLGFIPLFDNPFDCAIDYHHINNILVIPIPRTIHHNNYGKIHRQKIEEHWIYNFLGIGDIIK